MNTITISITVLDAERVRVTATWPGGHTEAVDIPADGLEMFLLSFTQTSEAVGYHVSVPAPGADTHYARRAHG